MAEPISPTTDIPTAAAQLRLDDLLRVLLTELTHQNPLKPVENKDFMAQIAQFASLDATQRLNGNIEQLLFVQAINQSVGLIGRRVSADVGGRVINGTVVSMSLTTGVPRLDVEDAITGEIFPVGIAQLQTVRQ